MNDSNGPRLAEILEGYFAEVSAGRSPDADAIVAKNPDLAEDLRAGLQSLDFFRRARSPGEEPDPCAGRAMGDFRIVREIGRGGMGVVYEAEQISLRRRVALKVLPFAAVLDAKQLQRFRNEAHAAANLHHTNIVPVYGVGSERGVHYYAMQYIEGESLAVAIGGMKGGGAGEGSGRTPISSHSSNREPRYLRMAARLGVQAAEALDHAHQLGVVHRDIKPGNLLVDTAGTLWITDFGLARSRADAGLTMTGEIVGTLRYMSPEQALAKRVPVDHRTDIYSLGATLYELFTLELAFPGDNPPDVIHDVAFKDPVSPRRLNPALPVDLETILMKAMSKDAASRYATAQEMADDLRRFLDARPIQARPPTLPDRAWKWARRHRGLVLASSVVLLVGVVGLGVGAALLAREQQRTSDEQRRTSAALDRAHDNLNLAHGAVNEFLTQLGIHGLKDEPLPTPTREALLKKALQFYDNLLAEREHPTTLGNRSNILHALHRYDEALAIADRLLATKPDDAVSLEVRGHMLWHLKRYNEALAALDEAARLDPARASVHVNRGYVLQEMKRPDDALAAYDRALEIDPEVAFGHHGRGRALLSLERLDDALAAFGRAIAVGCNEAHSGLASVLFTLGRHAEALAACDRALEIDPSSAAVHTNRGGVRESLKRSEDALAAYGRALALDPNWARAHSGRGDALRSLGRSTEALEAFDRALAIEPKSDNAHNGRGRTLSSLRRYDDALAAYDCAIEINPNAAAVHGNRGLALHSLGRLKEALAASDRAIELDPDFASAHGNRAGCLAALRRYDEALAACDRAIEIDPDLAGTHSNRGAALRSLRRFDEALAAHDRALKIDPDCALAHVNRAGTLDSLRRFDEALAASDRAIEIDPDLAAAHVSRGNTLHRLGRFDEALAAFDRALEIDPDCALAHDNSGLTLHRLGRFDEALAAHDRAIAIDPNDAAAHDNRGVALQSLGRFEEALAAWDRAIAIHPDRALTHSNRCAALQSLRRFDEALAACDRALKIDPDCALAHSNRAGTLHSLGRFDEALDACDRTIAIDADLEAAHSNRGASLLSLGRFDEALAAYDRAIALGGCGPALNNLAWLLATTQDERLRDAARAVDLAREAVRRAPADRNCWGTLGVALCRTGSWGEGLKALEKAQDPHAEGDARDWFFVAMAHWHLGRKEEARRWYDKGVAWMKAKAPKDAELERFRAEAAALLVGVRPEGTR